MLGNWEHHHVSVVSLLSAVCIVSVCCDSRPPVAAELCVVMHSCDGNAFTPRNLDDMPAMPR